MKVILALLSTTQHNHAAGFVALPPPWTSPSTLSTEQSQRSEPAMLCRSGQKMNKLHRGEVPKTCPEDVWLTDFSSWCFLH